MNLFSPLISTLVRIVIKVKYRSRLPLLHYCLINGKMNLFCSLISTLVRIEINVKSYTEHVQISGVSSVVQ